MKYRYIPGTAIVVAGVIFALAYGSEGREIPDEVFNLLVAVGAVLLIVAVPWWIASYGILPVIHFFRRYEYHWPMITKGKPKPWQWALDLIAEQKGRSHEYLVLKSCTAVSLTRDDARPYLTIRFRYHNYSVLTLEIESPQGDISWNGERLPESISQEFPVSGNFLTGPNQELNFGIRVFIPEQYLAEVCKEYDAGVIGKFQFYSSITVRPNENSLTAVRIGLNPEVIKVNQ